MPQRVGREPKVEDVRELMGASTPHFALQIRNRIRALIPFETRDVQAGLSHGEDLAARGR